MKKIFLLLVLFIYLHPSTFAQCPPYPAAVGCGLAEPNCAGIDGYCNTLIPQTQLTEPIPDCGGTAVLNNDDWLAFYAGTETISIQIIPSNCEGPGPNIGMQAGVYAACDDEFGVNGDGIAFESLIVQCSCTNGPIILSSSNFVVGQIYYLFIDGCRGDICDYEINVLEGTTLNPEIQDLTGDILGDTSFCSGDIAIFSVDPVENATYYNWTIDSNASILNGQGSTEVEVSIEAETSIEICVTASNGCSTGTESCFTFTSEGEADVDTLFEPFCIGDSIEFEGNIYSESGIYSAVYPNAEGCDSILNLDLTVYPDFSLNVDEILPEDGGFYNGIFYDTDTTFIEELTTIFGCDSLVTINIILGGGPCPPDLAAIGCGLAVTCCNGIDGFSATLTPQTQITEPIPDCGGTAVMNNDNWLAFYAGTETISIQIIPTNCEGPGPNIGIQAGIYTTCDIDGGVNQDGLAGGSLLVQCSCTTDPIVLTYGNYVIGQTYYLLVDGCGGDICDYVINVTEGSTQSTPPDDPTGINGPTTIMCSGDIVEYYTDPVVGIPSWNWSVQGGNIIGNSTSNPIYVEWFTSGSVTLFGENDCYAITPQSIDVMVSMNEIDRDTLFESFCFGDSIEFEGQVYMESGFYTEIYTNVGGCDSILNLDLTVYESFDIHLEVSICEGENYTVGDSVYFETGSYLNQFSSVHGCDSLVNLELSVLPTYSTTIDTVLASGGDFYHDVFYDIDTTIFEEYVAVNGCDSLVTVNITIEPLSVSLPHGLTQLSLFPNPASNKVYLNFILEEAMDFKLDVFNTLGQKVDEIKLASRFSQGKHFLELYAGKLAIGTYFFHFQTENRNITKRIVIVR